MKKYVYLTTPIYYINAKPHIGHAYTTLAADVYNRFLRTRGEETFLLTGTDEHGLKIEQAAKEAGKPLQEYCDEASARFRDLWKTLDVVHDDFVRTTEPRHTAVVQKIFQALSDSKDIYKGRYSGYYCVSDETYWTETDLGPKSGRKGDPVCPSCGRPLVRVEEDSYFFALSRYQGRLLEHYKKHPEFLQPAHRANEILRFVEEGLRDLSVSRTKVAWGIPVPFDPSHTIYVWFDALINYVSAAGYLREKPQDGGPSFDELWPADIQLVGKEIYRFHAVIWPAVLMALGLPLPRTVFAHGWWTVDGEKMSKSKGNFVDPAAVIREFGVDPLRYFLFREMPFGGDGDFSLQALRKRYNADLANDLGNLVSRVIQMVDKYLAGELPRRPPLERPLISKEVASESQAIYECMERLGFSEALNRIWAVISRLNQRVDKEAPWTLPESDPQKLRFLLFDLVWSLRIVAGWIYPFMPQTSAKMHSMLGVRRHSRLLTVGEVLGEAEETKILKSPPLFPRK